jgi:hypothetical protein
MVAEYLMGLKVGVPTGRQIQTSLEYGNPQMKWNSHRFFENLL